MEDYSGISAGVKLITGSDDYKGNALTNPTIPAKYRIINRSFIHLKKHALLATNVVVHPGITIGEGAIAASGSVVTKDLDDWGIYRGIPAKKVGERRRDIILEQEKLVYEEMNIIPSKYTDCFDYNLPAQPKHISA